MTERTRRTHTLILGLALLLVLGCAAAPFSKNETPGEHFNRAMKNLATNCANAKVKKNDTACDILKLKPADPLATEEGRFAHSIQIPNPVPEDSGYKSGMTPAQYFDHLCKTEAGEFIYKTVENVEGLYMMRPRKRATDYELEHLYALEDPYGAVDTGAFKPQDYLIQQPFGRYEFLESLPPFNTGTSQPRFIRYFRGASQNSRRDFVFMKDSHSERVPYVVETEPNDELRSRYGYTWRGIKRAHDREYGIAGSESIVFSLNSNEVLGVQRRFILSGGVRNNLTGIWWLNGQVCPQFGENRLSMFDFIAQVLKPKNERQPEK